MWKASKADAKMDSGGSGSKASSKSGSAGSSKSSAGIGGFDCRGLVKYVNETVNGKTDTAPRSWSAGDVVEMRYSWSLGDIDLVPKMMAEPRFFDIEKNSFNPKADVDQLVDFVMRNMSPQNQAILDKVWVAVDAREDVDSDDEATVQPAPGAAGASAAAASFSSSSSSGDLAVGDQNGELLQAILRHHAAINSLLSQTARNNSLSLGSQRLAPHPGGEIVPSSILGNPTLQNCGGAASSASGINRITLVVAYTTTSFQVVFVISAVIHCSRGHAEEHSSRM